jgi:hypothetical protein
MTVFWTAPLDIDANSLPTDWRALWRFTIGSLNVKCKFSALA